MTALGQVFDAYEFGRAVQHHSSTEYRKRRVDQFGLIRLKYFFDPEGFLYIVGPPEEMLNGCPDGNLADSCTKTAKSDRLLN